jgi:xanthine dehydrogenase accessory factor
MKEFRQQVEAWWLAGKRVALARVIETWGSSPRPVGSCMFISEDGNMLGSVSGGCVEGAVVQASKNVLALGEARILHYGISDDDAWAVGLSCGGKLRVLLQPWSENNVTTQLTTQLEQNKGGVLVTHVRDGSAENFFYPGDVVIHDVSAREAFEKRISQLLTVGNQDWFIHILPPRSRLLIIGAAHITADLIKLANDFDFETTVIDPRKAFAERTTFAVQPDRIIQAYPSEAFDSLQLDANTYAVILSHDPKIDDDALKVLLRKPVAYIGALGSRKNHEKRSKRLQEAGFSAEEINRINAPIGVDIRAQGAKEIALSILGAIIRAKNQYL